jgi:uncharacterized membrane protein YfcA
MWFGYEEREATGTSLAAIIVIAALASATHGVLGNIHVGAALAVGLPAVAGVVAGTALQQRVSSQAIAGIFALFLVGSAVALVIG